MWTTDTFLQNLARFSVLKGQGCDRPTAVGMDTHLSGATLMQNSTLISISNMICQDYGYRYYKTMGRGWGEPRGGRRKGVCATLMGASEVTSEAKG